MKYIIVYNVNEYPEMGGGIHFESFLTDKELDDRVSEIFPIHDIIISGQIEEFKYRAIEKVTKIERFDD